MTGDCNYISNSKKGLLRKKNQDRTLILSHKDFYLFAVFDGISSLPHSGTFINYFIKRLKTNIDVVDNYGSNLDFLLFNTNSEVSNYNIDGKSTLSAIFYNPALKIADYINVGDSRIYNFNTQFLEQITTDDSIKGLENVVTKCLGLHTLTLDDFKPKHIKDQYNFLICSDGFYKLMESDLKQYFTTLNFKNALNIKKKLSYLQKGKNQDDSSYILIKNEL